MTVAELRKALDAFKDDDEVFYYNGEYDTYEVPNLEAETIWVSKRNRRRHHREKLDVEATQKNCLIISAA